MKHEHMKVSICFVGGNFGVWKKMFNFGICGNTRPVVKMKLWDDCG